MDLLPVYIISCCLSAVCVLLYLCYRYLRQRFPVRVTCWFCHEVTTVPYGNKNCWDCLCCEQYNGFTKDGDYNKKIPAMYDSSMNHGISCKPSEFMTFNKQLCDRCNNNLHLKARLLADFVPVNEASFDKEIEMHSQRLDKWYDICIDCHMIVQQELQKQDAMLLQKLKSFDQLWQEDNTVDDGCIKPNPSARKNITGSNRMYKVFELLSVACLSCILLNIVLNSDLSPKVIEDLAWIKIDSDAIHYIYLIGCVADILSKIVLMSKHYRLHLVDASVILWIDLCLLKFIFNNWTSDMLNLYICVANLVLVTYSVLIKRRKFQSRVIKINRLSLGVKNSNSRFEESKPACSDKKMSTLNSQDPSVSSTNILGNFEDTMTGLKAFTFGTPTKVSSKKSIFSSTFRSPDNTAPFPDKLSHKRPLISPAKLKIMKFSKQYGGGSQEPHKSGSPIPSNSNHDLISSTSSQLSLASTPSQHTFGSSSDYLSSSGSHLSVASTSSQLGSLCSGKHTESKTVDEENNSEESHSSKSSVCPVDSTTTNTKSISGYKASLLKSVVRKEVLYVSILVISLTFNAYLTWLK